MAKKNKKDKKSILDNIMSVKDSLLTSTKVKPTGELVENTSYEFSPSYVYHNGLYSTTVQLYTREGSNRLMSFTDILDIIPSSPNSGIKIYMIEKDGIIRDEEKNALIRANATAGKTAINAEYEKRAEVKNDDKASIIEKALTPDKDASAIEQDRANVTDYSDYEMLINTPQPIVFYQFQLRIVGSNIDDIEEQIADLNASLDRRHAGMKWDSTAGDQKDRLVMTFAPLRKLINVDTSTAQNYAGINFAASPALCDTRGVAIGDDVLSLVGSSAIFDFENSTDKQAFISIPSSESMSLYDKGNLSSISVASIVAQAAANDIVMNGHRAAHIVLNDFDYFDNDRRFAREVNDKAFKVYDVARETVNPLQGFGSITDVVPIFTRLNQKIVNIFDLLMDYRFEKDIETGIKLRGQVTEAVNSFYVRNGYWTADAALYPQRTNIVNIERPSAYATMGSLIQSFTTMEDNAHTRGSASQADISRALHALLVAALSQNFDILGRTTSIQPSDALQVYYDFKRISSTEMVQVQFLNMLDFILYTLKAGDAVVIHGANKLQRFLMDNMAQETIQAAQKRGIRFIFAFDTITSPKTKTFDGANPSDMFTMHGSYYTDFGSDVSWSMTGALMADEIEKYASIMSNQGLSDVIVANAMVRNNCQVLLHRNAGQINNFIRLACVI